MKAIWNGVLAALAERPVLERFMFIFWLTGPFMLLIERTPADAWLSTLSLAFVARSLAQREWAFTRLFWVRCAFSFWIICIISAFLSELPLYSLGEAVAWFRFPLFAMATVFWLAQDRRLLHAMLVITALGMMVMCGILAAEFFIEGQKGGRLTWPYGDLVPGGYLAKVGMPAFVVMVALAMSRNKIIASSAIVLTTINLGMSVLAGERINFLLRLCSGGLAVFAWRFNKLRAVFLGCVAAIAVGLVFVISPENGQQFSSRFFSSLTSGFESDYFRVLGGGLAVFEQASTFGIGPGNYRLLAEDMLADLPHLRADNHPHNFYIQFLAETGVVGAVAGTTFLWSIVWSCFRARRSNTDDVLLATAFIVPFGMFWPIATTADFFGQWNNIFLWFGVALALAISHSGDRTPGT